MALELDLQSVSKVYNIYCTSRASAHSLSIIHMKLPLGLVNCILISILNRDVALEPNNVFL
jgi:hypothetical protein